MPRKQRDLNTLDGSRWRHSHQKTVNTVLARIDETRPVESKGGQFYNMDSWTARAFTGALCEWARLNPGSTPDRGVVESWVYHANRRIYAVPEYQRHIRIAATPDELPVWLAMALVGGGYHEAWHTLYSRRTHLHIDEVWPMIQSLWGLVPHDPSKGRWGWAKLTEALLDWGNIIEDIRIERCGNRAFPGAPSKLEALQDLILKQEDAARERAKAEGRAINDELSVVTGTFRDLGLGYETPLQKARLRAYEERAPDAYLFVVEGPLKSLVERSIALDSEDDLGHLWLAMEVVAAIVMSAEPPPPPEEGEESDGEESDGGEGSPQPPPQMPDQLEASDMADGSEGEGEAQSVPMPDKPLLYKKGDRAVLKAGPHKGRTVEVTKASLPHPETGVQNLEFALVEED